MTPEQENAVLHYPSGCRLTLLFCAYVKYALTTMQMRTGERLQFLEWLNAALPPAALAIIQPMSKAEVKMVHEARSLDNDDDQIGQRSFDVLTSCEVFKDFLELNPSLLDAIMQAPSTIYARAIPSAVPPPIEDCPPPAVAAPTGFYLDRELPRHKAPYARTGAA